jgi:hypothetical protein
VVRDHRLETFLQLIYIVVLHFTTGHVLYLVEKHLRRVHARGVARERQGHDLVCQKERGDLGLQDALAVVNQVAFNHQVGRHIRGNSFLGLPA